MMPDISPAWWVVALAAALVIAAFVFGGFAWGVGVLVAIGAAFVVLVIYILSNTRFT